MNEVVVAGHICIDIIPTLGDRKGGLEDIMVPGKLVNVGPAVTSTGGVVSNTGLALHRLGTPTALMGKVGDDIFGRAILDLLRAHAPALAEGMIVVAGEHTSYTVTINPPEVDRIFLHYPGANDTFGADDVDYDKLTGARLFHFGYPPVMRRMFTNGGAEMQLLFRRVKEKGLTTSLDMAKPDPASEAGQTDWVAFLEAVLPHVDIVLPTLDETLFMLDRPHYEQMVRRAGSADVVTLADGDLLARMAQRLMEMGVGIVVLKLGDQGMYLRTTGDQERLSNLGRCRLEDPGAWVGREILAPCFQAEVAGTTGAGDTTVAGFLAALIAGLSPQAASTSAVAVGACSVEQPDATSGVPSWDQVQNRILRGWARREISLNLTGWRWDQRSALWLGPNDQVGS